MIFHASVYGVDSTLTEDDLKCFLTGKHIVFNEAQFVKNI